MDQDEAEPAHILIQGVAYVRGWARARRAVEALQRQLHACGLDDALPYLKADVNSFGNGIIDLGRITPETAEALANLLANAHAITKKTHVGTPHDPTTPGRHRDPRTHSGHWPEHWPESGV